MYIKGFDKDLRCKGFQFKIGKTYKTKLFGTAEPLMLCKKGAFHFCKNIQQVHTYYECNSTNRYCEIEPLGRIIESDDKMASDKIKIVREIVGDELNTLLGKINGNAGLFNTGDFNAGYRNRGNFNTGNSNTGHRNTGHSNTGYYNTGDFNAGYRNRGHFNTGDCNTGDCNTGHRNTGNRNTGDCNIGHCNTGDCNTGDCNTGDYNTGLFNSCNFSNGVFCTKEPTIKIFDIDSGMTMREFLDSKYHRAICSSSFDLTEWKDEKLIKHTFFEACAKWWENMSGENKKIIMSIPNFDKEKFFEITGIKTAKKGGK